MNFWTLSDGRILVEDIVKLGTRKNEDDISEETHEQK